MRVIPTFGAMGAILSLVVFDPDVWSQGSSKWGDQKPIPLLQSNSLLRLDR